MPSADGRVITTIGLPLSQVRGSKKLSLGLLEPILGLREPSLGPWEPSFGLGQPSSGFAEPSIGL